MTLQNYPLDATRGARVMTKVFATILVSLSLVAIAGCGGSSQPNFSAHIERSITRSGTSQYQAEFGKDVSVTGARCVQQTGTQSYSCVAHVTYGSGLETYTRSIAIRARCQTDVLCAWNTR